MPRVPRSMSRVRPPVCRVEVEAQRQRMQVAEHAAARCVRIARCVTLREHELAQLGEERRRQPQQAVGDEQRERHARARLCVASRLSTICFSTQRHADVRELRRDQEGERDDDAPLVLPEVGQQRADRRPVAGACGTSRPLAVGSVGSARWRMRRSDQRRARDSRRYGSEARAGSSAAANACDGAVRQPLLCRRSPGSPSPRARCRRRSTCTALRDGDRGCPALALDAAARRSRSSPGARRAAAPAKRASRTNTLASRAISSEYGSMFDEPTVAQ